MKARSVVAGVLAAGAMLVGGAMVASANVIWCLEDPAVQVQTATGTNLTVNVTVAVPQGQAKYVNDVHIQTLTAPDGAGGTLISVAVTTPATISTANVTVTVKKYKATDFSTVSGGTTTILYLDVPAA
jgi:arabinogalactan endo-1,4-beta-galactosidase